MSYKEHCYETSTHLLEGIEASQDGSSDPCRVFALWRSVDLDLYVLERKLLDLVQ